MATGLITTALCWTIVLQSTQAAPSTGAAQAQEETIAGISIEVRSEFRSRFETIFVIVVIPNEAYSRRNLELVWRHYCEKYADKKARLDVRIYARSSYEYDNAFQGLPRDVHSGEVISGGIRFELRGPDAMFERKGDGILAYGGDNESMIYRPNLDEPEKTETIMLAGKNR